MSGVLGIVIEFGISYTLVLLLYYFLFIFRKTKYNKDKIPVEYYYLTKVYGIKDKDIDYKRFMYLTLFVNSFIVVSTYMIVFELVNGWFMQIICGFVIAGLLIIICYGIIGRYYMKK